MINENIINDFKKGLTIKELSNKYNINRKKLSIELRKLGYETSKKENSKEINSEDLEKIISMYNNKRSLREISREYKVSHHYIRDVLIKNHIINIDVSNIQDIIYQKYFIEECNMDDICNELNITSQLLRDTFNHNGWNFRKSGRVKEFTENIFQSIDTYDKAYWLGFLFADGYNNIEKGELEIGLQYQDRKLLEKFIKFINGNERIKIKSKENILNNKKFVSCKITLGSKQLCNDLNILGCTNNKSLSLQFVKETFIALKFIPSFIAGYFDGDGSIFKDRNTYRISFTCGNINFLEKLQDILIDLNIVSCKTKIVKSKRGNVYSYSINKFEDVIKFHTECFKNINYELCGLDRKIEKFNDAISLFNTWENRILYKRNLRYKYSIFVP